MQDSDNRSTLTAIKTVALSYFRLMLVVLLSIAVINFYYFISEENLLPVVVFIPYIFGTVLAFFTLKIAFLVVFHKHCYGRRFDGSHFFTALIISTMFFASFALMYPVFKADGLLISSSDFFVIIPALFIMMAISLFVCFNLASWITR